MVVGYEAVRLLKRGLVLEGSVWGIMPLAVALLADCWEVGRR